MSTVEAPWTETEALGRWLRTTGRAGPGSRLVPLAGGVSSLVAAVDDDGDRWVVKSPLDRLAVADEWHADRRRGANEATALALLAGRVGPLRVPRLRFFDEVRTVLGEELVEDVPGEGPPPTYKAELLAGRPRPAVAAALGAGAAALHRLAVPDALAGEGPRALFDQLRVDPYYRWTARQRPELAELLARLVADTVAAPQHLVHGDLTPKNVLVPRQPGSPPVLVDWEVVHAGDPAFDLGVVTAHLALKAQRNQSVASRRRTAEALSALWAAYDGPADRARSLRHAGGVMLARLYGKSPVDYLEDPDERRRAHQLGVRALGGGVADVDALLAAVAAGDEGPP